MICERFRGCFLTVSNIQFLAGVNSSFRQVYLTVDRLVLPSLLRWNSRPFCSPRKVRLQPSFQGQLLRLGFAAKAQGGGKGRQQEGTRGKSWALECVLAAKEHQEGHLSHLTMPGQLRLPGRSDLDGLDPS